MRFLPSCFGAFIVIAGMIGTTTARAETFTFESLTPTFAPPATIRPGALSSLSLTGATVNVGIARAGGARFDLVSNIADQAGKPVSYGNVSLDPFANSDAGTGWIINFSVPVTSVSLDFGDYGDDDDVITLTAFSGTNLTGTALGSNDNSLSGNTFSFTGGSIALSRVGIRSIGLSSTSSTGFANSLFLDNLTVTAATTVVPEVNTLVLFGLILPVAGTVVLRRKK